MARLMILNCLECKKDVTMPFCGGVSRVWCSRICKYEYILKHNGLTQLDRKEYVSRLKELKKNEKVSK